MYAPSALNCSLSTNAHRCFITRHKRGHKTNWTKTRSTHDLTHASQSVLSLKSQQGVFETISIRSLGFVCPTTSVVKKELVKELRQGPGKEASLLGLLNDSAYERRLRHLVTSGLTHIKHILSLGFEGGDPAPDLLHTMSQSQQGRLCQVPALNSCIWSLQKECPNLLQMRINHGKSMN